MISAPQDPASGDAVLPWAKQVNRFLRMLIPQPSADIFPKTDSGGTRMLLRRRGKLAVGYPMTFLCNVEGDLKNVDVLITDIRSPDPDPGP